LRLEREGDDFVLKDDPLRGKVEWRIYTVAGEVIEPSP
jgi:hypothetical protein